MKNSSILKKSINRISKIILVSVVAVMFFTGCGTNPASSVPAVVAASKDAITVGGDYSFDGDRTDAIVIDAPNEEVTLSFNDVRIETVSGPAIRIVDAGKVSIVIPEGTESSIIDSPKYEVGDYAQGSIYSKCDVIITGGGTLNVNGYYKNAIQCKDRVYIENAMVNITSKGDGIRANDGIEIDDAIISCESERHGFVTRKEGKDDKGIVKITKSDVSIIAGGYGIKSKTDLIMDAVKMNINAVLGQFDVTGESYIGEGCIINE